jgi:hypothetical protein
MIYGLNGPDSENGKRLIFAFRKDGPFPAEDDAFHGAGQTFVIIRQTEALLNPGEKNKTARS